MGCAASKAPPKRDPVEELIEEVHAQQGRESQFGTHPALTAIECNNCSLERLPPSKALRAALPALEYLTVHQNRIAELPALDLPEFTTLNAGGNPREAAWKS